MFNGYQDRLLVGGMDLKDIIEYLAKWLSAKSRTNAI